MERSKTPPEDVEKANRQMDARDDRDGARRQADLRAATHPTSGAAVQHAVAGASSAADDHAGDGETADALKRAAENDGRV